MKALDEKRIALIAGTLGQGGAEKQLVYIARAIKEIGFNLHVYCLTQNEFYETKLKQSGIPVIWFGQHKNVAWRLIQLTRAVRAFEPDFVQSQHFYTNFYAAITARLANAMDIGAVRSNVKYELEQNGYWGGGLLYVPSWILANSQNATDILVNVKRKKNVLKLTNVIDLKEFDQLCASSDHSFVVQSQAVIVVTVARLIQAKRLDRLLKVAALLQTSVPRIQLVIVGEGPERKNLSKLVNELNLREDTVQFVGRRDDVPRILSQSDIFLSASDDEGFPNVLLEAMAAGLPIVTTPAGDCANIVKDGATGYIVNFEDVQSMAERLLLLAQNTILRRKMGKAGRNLVEKEYSVDNLPEQLIKIYQHIASNTQMKNRMQISFLNRRK